MESMRESFANPTSDYRTAPLWVWNDDMNAERIREQLTELRTHGFGGAFVHPRPGLITPYLSEEWFALWGEAMRIAESLGMKLYIYDENSYPSGFAGGHVSQELPDCLAQAVAVREIGSSAEELAGVHRLVQAYAYEGEGDTRKLLRDVTRIATDRWGEYGSRFLVFELTVPGTTPWLGGFAYTDVLRPEVTRKFLETTHEAYYARFGDRFGTTIPAIFTDEPAVCTGALYVSSERTAPFTHWFSGEFERLNGYDLRPCLPALFFDLPDDALTQPVGRIRFDYYRTMRELWASNSAEPISEWCEAHGVAYTGHYMEHHWPYPWYSMASPAVMSMYEYMHWPAIDMLLSSVLKSDDPYASYGHEEAIRNDLLLTLTVREAHSVANQFDRPRVLCESYGAGGWDASFGDFKRMGDWLMVHGINFINQHLTYSTIAGARKRDHPQSFDWRQPWWGEYAGMTEYQARLSFALSQGATRNRVLLLHPTTAAFLGKPEPAQGDPQPLDAEAYARLALRLCDQGIDYDFGDEFILGRHGSGEGGKLRVARRTYDVVVVPAEMLHMVGTTVELLRTYMEQGGTVLALRSDPAYVDGMAVQADRPIGLASHPNWKSVTLDTLAAAIEALVPVRFAWTEPERVPSGVAHLRRELGDGSYLCFIANPRNVAVASGLLLAGARAERWDAWDGSVKEAPRANSTEGTIRLDVELPAYGSALYRVFDDSAKTEVTEVGDIAEAASAIAPIDEAVKASSLRIAAEEDNVLPLHYCDLDVGTRKYEGIHTIQAGRFLFEHRGFDGNPWDSSVQFKRRVLDRDTFGPGSGFEVVYSFSIGEGGIPGRLSLFAERSEHYRLSVNGNPVDWKPDKGAWLDHHLGEADIAAFVTEGMNRITLTADVFSVFLEIEAVYLRGSFDVNAQDGRWTIGRANDAIRTGSWVEQGYPFYGGAFTYEKTFELDRLGGRVLATFPRWEGTVASVWVNGKMIGLLGAGNDVGPDLTPFAKPGSNEISLRVSGSFKNLLGPHLDPGKPRNSAWPDNWKRAPMFAEPSAEAYDLLPYGLLEEFRIRVVHD
ncbi:glycosyl hydrolase [Cohnella sp. GCM10027633]|uniref:glycosyl hydrolase n=1 Tax=unclassified Cohnella TaxID=2636738 RepID=UPI00362D1860